MKVNMGTFYLFLFYGEIVDLLPLPIDRQPPKMARERPHLYLCARLIDHLAGKEEEEAEVKVKYFADGIVVASAFWMGLGVLVIMMKLCMAKVRAHTTLTR